MKCKNKACDLPSMHRGRCRASNEASNTTRVPVAATNEIGATVAVTVEAGLESVGRSVGSSPTSRDPKQRWPREAYNSYMREYMRKRRQKVTNA